MALRSLDSFAEFIAEAPRIKRVRVRIRNGKIQRNVRVSGIKGYTFRGGHLTRMSAAEKRHRKMGARRAKIKRRASKALALIKRRRSLRRLHALMGK